MQVVAGGDDLPVFLPDPVAWSVRSDGTRDGHGLGTRLGTALAEG